MYANTKLFPSFKDGINELRVNLPYIKTYTGESFNEEEVVVATGHLPRAALKL